MGCRILTYVIDVTDVAMADRLDRALGITRNVLKDSFMPAGTRRRRRAHDAPTVARTLALHFLSRGGGGRRTLRSAAELYGRSVEPVPVDWSRIHHRVRASLWRVLMPAGVHDGRRLALKGWPFDGTTIWRDGVVKPTLGGVIEPGPHS